MATQIIKGICFTILFILFFFVVVLAFQMIWNATMPDVFGWHAITYLQALGLLAISRMLIGGFGFRWMNAEKGKFWKERMKMKMENMTEEERDEFKKKLWQKCRDW